MTDPRPVRTDFANADFLRLVEQLDDYLRITDGDDHAFYAAFNTVDALRHVVVFYDGATPAGCAAMKPLAPDTMEIKRMFVAPAYRGRGIAAVILAELERWAHESGFTRFVLETGIRQTAAIRLYEKSGFATIPNYGQYIGIAQSLCFGKAIRPAP